jgi:formate C-acetyltransferase
MNANVLVERSLDAYARYGATIADARRTCVCGCVSTAIEGKTAYIMGSTVNLAKPIELALYNGVDPTTGIQVGPETGDPESFATFEDFYQAFKTHLFKGIQAARRYEKVNNFLFSEYLQIPYRSALIEGSLEKGEDIWHGGSLYTATATTYNAGIDAANSLLAIKELIYDKKTLTFGELKAALDADFEGYELVQKALLNVPKHGNNVDADEEIVRRVYADAYDAFQLEGNNYVGQYGKPDAYSKSFHNYFGRLTGALPTGKKKGVALTDGSVSAQPGSDVSGPTALVTSAATVIDTVAYNSAHLNVKINPSTLKTQNGAAALVTLIDGFVNQGGNHIQFNCVDAETLKDAKVHPENHKDLVVRVAGFSAYFTKLHEGIQDELIARTEHDLAV